MHRPEVETDYIIRRIQKIIEEYGDRTLPPDLKKEKDRRHPDYSKANAETLVALGIILLLERVSLGSFMIQLAREDEERAKELARPAIEAARAEARKRWQRDYYKKKRAEQAEMKKFAVSLLPAAHPADTKP